MAFCTSITIQSHRRVSSVSRCTKRPVRAVGSVRMVAAPTTAPLPMHDRVFVSIDEPEESTAGGLVIPTSAKDKNEKTGVVIGVGPGRYSPQGHLEPMTVEVGDRVLWKDDFGSETVEIDGKECIALRVPSIVAKW